MIVVADVHLGKVQDTIEKNGLPSRVVDCETRLIEAVKFAADGGHSLVLAGDVFDSTSPAPYLIDEFFGVLQVAVENKVQVYILPGNHDCGVQFHSMNYADDLFPGIFVISKPMVVEVDGLKTLFLPHVPRQEMDFLVEKDNSYAGHVQKLFRGRQQSLDAIIGHAHVSGAKNASDVEIEAGDALAFNPSDYPKFKVAVFGHIHKHQVLRKKIVYTGPVVTNSFDEAEQEKGFIEINLENEQPWIFHLYQTPETEYKHITIDLVNKDTLKLDPYKIREVAGGKLLKITVYARDAMQVDQQLIRKRFNEFGKVVRWETIICNEVGEIDDETADEVFEKVNFVPVFESWVKSKKLPTAEEKLAIELGKEVIGEVLHAE